jgi:hypothetical protein
MSVTLLFLIILIVAYLFVSFKVARSTGVGIAIIGLLLGFFLLKQAL